MRPPRSSGFSSPGSQSRREGAVSTPRAAANAAWVSLDRSNRRRTKPYAASAADLESRVFFSNFVEATISFFSARVASAFAPRPK